MKVIKGIEISKCLTTGFAGVFLCITNAGQQAPGSGEGEAGTLLQAEASVCVSEHANPDESGQVMLFCALAVHLSLSV